MKKYVFLYRIANSDYRDCCAYLDNSPVRFECGHYFGSYILHGSCYSGHDWADYSDIETILTEDEYTTLQKISHEFNALGFSVERGSERYNRGVELGEQAKPIFEKLNSEEAEEFFNKIIDGEKETVMVEHGLTLAEVEEAFDNYPLDYQDRSIIGNIFDDCEELGREEAYQLWYVESGSIMERYFDFEKFGEDLVDEEGYFELSSGRCVNYSL